MNTHPRSGCPINLTLEVVGDAWSLLVLRDMTARFLTDRVPLAQMRKELRNDPAGFDPGYWTAGAELGWPPRGQNIGAHVG